jgi:putative hydrolase of the HAD superfamily
MDNKIVGNGKIEVILFDFGGVIAEEGFRNGLKVIAKANGLEENEFIQAAFDAVYSSGYVLGKGSENDFWNTLKQNTGLKGDNASLWNEMFSRFVVRDWMIDLVQRLKEKKLTVGILSDQTDMLDRLDDRDDFYRWFDQVFNSYYLGKGKRDPSLFDDIAHTLKTEPDRILFIDDNSGNVDRARQMGWQVIQYVDRESFEKDFEKILPMRG